MKNILIAVSGTGGHVYPGIALAGELKKAGYNPVFVVNDNTNGVSVNIVKQSGYGYRILHFFSPPRKISLKLLLFPFTFVKSLFSARKIIGETSPEAVIGMGAYLSLPVLLTAKIKKIPTLIHEQNSVPGLANKILSKFVDKIAVSFEQSQKYFNESKTLFTSNPVRKDIFNISRTDAAKKLNIDANVFTVFVFGGSLGAAKLNAVMLNIAEKLYAEYEDKIQFIHILGNRDFKNISEKYKNIRYKKYITEYMNDIGNAYACSDIIVCRAGAGTVKEVEMYGLGAVFIPFPHATDNHQYFNAKNSERVNFRYVIEEKNLTENVVTDIIKKHFNDKIDVKRIVKPGEFPQEQLAQEVIKLIK